MPSELYQTTMRKAQLECRLFKANDQPSLLLLIKGGVKINILCGLEKQTLKSTHFGLNILCQILKAKKKKKGWTPK